MDRNEERKRRVEFLEQCTERGLVLAEVSAHELADDALQKHTEDCLAELSDGQRRELLLLFLRGNREVEGWLFTGPSGRSLGNALRRWMKSGSIWVAPGERRAVADTPLEARPEFQTR